MNNITMNLTCDTALQWIEQLKQVSEETRLSYMDIIVDQAGLRESIIPALMKPEHNIQWFSLFTGTPEEGLLEYAPILFRIEWENIMHLTLMEEIFELLHGMPRILTLFSPLSFSQITKNLSVLSEAEWGNVSCLLRFYDSRIFPELIKDILTPEQRGDFTDLAYVWGYLNRDSEARWVIGSFTPETEDKVFSVVLLDDNKIGRLGSISDAEELMDYQEFYDRGLSREENFSVLYRYALQALNSNYLGELSDYIRKNDLLTE